MASEAGMRTASDRRPGLPRAPLVPVAGAVAAGGGAGRGWRRLGVSLPALVVAFVALGAGWHHHNWSDLEPDDLAWDASDEPRPAWVRGVLVEVPTFHHGEGPADEGATRTI